VEPVLKVAISSVLRRQAFNLLGTLVRDEADEAFSHSAATRYACPIALTRIETRSRMFEME
jgi:hypothetical protein